MIFLILTLLLCCQNLSQSENTNDDIKIDVLDYKINSNILNMDIQLTNNTDLEFILYGFNVTRLTHDEITKYEEVGFATAGNLLIVLNESFEPIYPEIISDHFHSYARIPDLDSLKNEIEKESNKFKERLILEPKKEIKKRLEFRFNFNEFNSQPYYAFLHYYVGDRLSIHVDSTEMNNVQKEGKILFKGWIRSDTIKLSHSAGARLQRVQIRSDLSLINVREIQIS